MTGMVNHLNLVANEVGVYEGRSANYSGPGFAKMKFVVEATEPVVFEAWIQSVHASQRYLDDRSYAMLASSDTADALVQFGAIDRSLFDTIVGKFMDTNSAFAEHTH